MTLAIDLNDNGEHWLSQVAKKKQAEKAERVKKLAKEKVMASLRKRKQPTADKGK